MRIGRRVEPPGLFHELTVGPTCTSQEGRWSGKWPRLNLLGRTVNIMSVQANTFLLLMHGGASIMLWVCIEYRMNAAEYREVLEEKAALEFFKLKGEASGDGSPFGMTMTRSTQQRQYWNGIRTVLEWSSQSPEDK